MYPPIIIHWAYTLRVWIFTLLSVYLLQDSQFCTSRIENFATKLGRLVDNSTSHFFFTSAFKNSLERYRESLQTFPQNTQMQTSRKHIVRWCVSKPKKKTLSTQPSNNPCEFSQKDPPFGEVSRYWICVYHWIAWTTWTPLYIHLRRNSCSSRIGQWVCCIAEQCFQTRTTQLHASKLCQVLLGDVLVQVTEHVLPQGTGLESLYHLVKREARRKLHSRLCALQNRS